MSKKKALDIYKDCAWDAAADGPTNNPLQSIHCLIAGSPKDMSADNRDAWIYGVAVGWDNKVYKELMEKHGWDKECVDRNKMLHQEYIKLWGLIKPKR